MMKNVVVLEVVTEILLSEIVLDYLLKIVVTLWGQDQLDQKGCLQIAPGCSIRTNAVSSNNTVRNRVLGQILRGSRVEVVPGSITTWLRRSLPRRESSQEVHF